MFRIFTTSLCLSFLCIALVDCSIGDLEDLTAELKQLKALLQRLAHHGCFPKNTDTLKMKLHRFSHNATATCNDGTAAGYYLRKAHGSKRWIVYLEGGEFCNSAASCNERYKKKEFMHLMSSTTWPEKRIGTGILSTDPRENPSWWNANHVFIPYCSSDVWSGNVSRSETGDKFSFLGTRILDKVIEELMPKGLSHAKHLLLAGSSAGGIGVILNLDRLAKRLKDAKLKVQVRGLADSGWYIDISAQPALGNNMIQQGMTYWRGVVPKDCARRHPTKGWKCYFAENVYRTDSKSPKHSPLFVFQWLYDQAQLAWALSGSFQMPDKLLIDNDRISFVALQLGKRVKESLNRTKSLACAIFAPSCVSHTILMRDDWLKVKVGGKNLNDALDDWYQSSGDNSNCKPLIESKCDFPHCSKTCPRLEMPPRKVPRSHGVPIKPRSERGLHQDQE